jgi:hypothetical protein
MSFMREIDSGLRTARPEQKIGDVYPKLQFRNPKSPIRIRQETPRLGQIKGGESTQAIGASFWLDGRDLSAAREKMRIKKCPGSVLPGGKEHSSLCGHSVGFRLRRRGFRTPKKLFQNFLATALPIV